MGASRSTPAGQAPVILFDGVCNLCNGTINWIIDRDRAGQFRFATLQSEAARRLLDSTQCSGDPGESVVLIEGGRVLKRSSAVLTAAKMLGWPWRIWYGLMLVPRPIRDAVYDFVARHRYRWFGRTDVCRVPTPELKARFLE